MHSICLYVHWNIVLEKSYGDNKGILQKWQVREVGTELHFHIQALRG